MTAYSIPGLLRHVVGVQGSDLHLTACTPPQVRIDGELQPLDGPPCSAADTARLAYSVLTPPQRSRFEHTHELDFSFGVEGVGRFRCNMFSQRGAVAAVYRVIPQTIRSFDELRLPPAVAALADRPRGLVLVTGPTGSGKSTTLAAMIDKINRERRAHILTVEDPIEFVHPHRLGLVNQREVPSDTQTFAAALRGALRADPDVVLIGEMRDLETVEAALTIAETGSLTLATLHTNSASQTITRIVDIFPAAQQSQIRTQLALTLEGIVCQELLPRIGGGRVPLLEVLIATPAIRNLIRENKIHQMCSAMQTGQEKSGMQTANQALVALYTEGLITLETARSFTSNVDELEGLLMRGPRRCSGRN